MLNEYKILQIKFIINLSVGKNLKLKVVKFINLVIFVKIITN